MAETTIGLGSIINGLQQSNTDIYNQKQSERKSRKDETSRDNWMSFLSSLEKVMGDSFVKGELESEKLRKLFNKKQQDEELKTAKENRKKLLELESQYAETKNERLNAKLKLISTTFIDGFKDSGKQFTANLEKSLSSSLSKFTNAVGNSVSQYAGLFAQYQSSINARLQGTSYSFGDLFSTIRTNTAVSPYVKQTAVLENLSKLVSSGISFNLEQRAFLATISDKIATTFDAFDASLLSIIRIQQADTTGARLGMEASLTTYLNNMFSDTSYLNGSYNTVEGALFSTLSTMNYQTGLEFEYQVQKWLGSLESVGVGSNTITNIANILNALGSGDISGLTSNSSLMSLLAIASNGQIGSLINNGLNASNVNDIMLNLVNYLGSLQGNNAVKTSLATTFGVSRSDLEAIANLSSSDLSSIYNNTLSYSGALGSLSNQLSMVGDRMHISEKIQNVFDNLMGTVGGGIASSVGAYTSWLVADLIEKSTGGINIPYVSVLGSGVDMNATVTQLMKLGIAGYGALSQIGNIANALSNGGSLSMANWGGLSTKTTNRGTGITRVSKGVSVGTSSTTYAANGGTDDIVGGVLSDNAVETTTGEAEDSNQKIMRALYDDENPYLKLIHTLLSNVISGNAVVVRNEVSSIPPMITNTLDTVV